MAKKEATIIIKRKKGGGHASHHGGAWKVAYADFVTAMMALFMVLWLISADEEVRISVSEYFNSYTKFQGSDSLNKNGRKAGGDASSRTDGDQGRYEEQLLEKPSQTTPVFLDDQDILNDLSDEKFDGAAFSRDVDADHVKLKAPGAVVFAPGSKELTPEHYKYLNKLAVVFKEYQGTVDIKGYADQSDQVGGLDAQDAQTINNSMWSLSFERAMVIRNYLVSVANVPPKKLIPVAAYRAPAGLEENLTKEGGRKVQFLLRHERK
jgi:chemotaxis protein MotB